MAAGFPCVFVRLAGCNLRCSYCDTTYAYDEGTDMDISKIVSRVESYHCPVVEITGGEPLMQEETPALISTLLDSGYKVLLETNGSFDISTVDKRCVKIIDIKCPSSGEEKSNDFKNLDRIKDKDEIKFVIGNKTDYEFAKTVLTDLREKTDVDSIIHFSPVFGQMDPDVLAKWILEDHLNVRLQIQIHKVIWGIDTRC